MFFSAKTSLDMHCLPPRGQKARNLAVVLLSIAPLAFGFFAVFLGQDANWDLRNYHWYNAYAFVNGRYLFDLLPSQTPFFYNPTLDVPFYLLASSVPAKLAGFVLGAVQGVNFILLFMLAHVSLIIPNPRHKVLACAAIAAAGMLGAGSIAQIGTTFYDNVTSIGIFFSALLIARHIEALLSSPTAKSSAFAFLAGLPAGLMMGLKLPSVIFCLGLCLAFLFVSGEWKRRFFLSFFFGIGVLVGTAITLGHWMWFLQENFQSPLFPYFNNFFKSPLAPLTSARDTQFIPHSWRDILLFPFVFAENPLRVGEIPWRDWKIPVLYMLLPFSIAARLLFGRSDSVEGSISAPMATRYLLWAFAISYAIWVPLFAIYRYIVPLEMIAPLLIVFAIGLLPLRVQTRAIIAAFVIVSLAATVKPGNWLRREEWLDRFIQVERPYIPNSSDIMILMAGFEPYSHVVSEFPPAIPFVRIQSNFSSPNENKGINRILRKRIESHKGRFMLLIPEWQHQLADEALAHFGLKISPNSCQKVLERLAEVKLDLCKVEKADKKTKEKPDV